MKASTFQAILVGNWVLYLAACFVPPSIFTSDPNLLDFLKSDGVGGPFGAALNDAIFWAFIAAYTAAQFGMVFFHGWARYLFLLATVLNVMDQFLCGVRVTYPAFSALNQVLVLSDGAVLALAYYSPLAKHFSKGSGP